MAYRAGLAAALGALALAGCSAAPASEAPAGESSRVDAVTSILNAGVSANMGGAKFLFDPLYDNHFGSLAEMDEPLIEAIINGSAPYDNVDAVFVSHAHGDHFSAEYLNRMMAAQPGVQLIAPAQAEEAMRGHELWQDGFAERITSVTLSNGEAAERIEVAGAVVEALRTPHAGWPERHSEVHNITFRVSATNAAGAPIRVMHMGDADPAAQHFTMNSRFFCCARTNVVMVPFWFFQQDQAGLLIDRTLNAERAIGVHVPVQTPAFLEGSDWTYFTKVGEEVSITPIAKPSE